MLQDHIETVSEFGSFIIDRKHEKRTFIDKHVSTK